MYQIELRRTNGEVLASGRGREWPSVATRLYRQATGLRGRSLMASQYHPTGAGGPRGTWHCQFGRSLPDGSATLDDVIVVHVG